MKRYLVAWLEGEKAQRKEMTVTARSAMMALDTWSKHIRDRKPGNTVLLSVCEIQEG